MPKTLSPEHVREIATVRRSTLSALAGGERLSRHIQRSEGFLESGARGYGGGVYALFDEMEEKDAHVYSILQTRKNGVLARHRRIEPASTSDVDREVAEWLTRTLANTRNFESAIAYLLGAMSRGMAVVEILWGYDSGGRVVPMELKPRSAARFEFADDGALVLNDVDFVGLGRAERLGALGDANRPLRMTKTPFGSTSNGRTASGVRRLPERKFMILLFGATDERPYGLGLLERVYWYWWFKKNNLKFWVLYNEKFGAPTVVATHAAGLSETERERLLEVIGSLQSDAGVTVPEGITLELLEAGRRGSAETFGELANWCNGEMSRAVVGQTLTVDEGRRGGSLALAKVHEAVRFDYVRTDACLLMDAMNSQLIRWTIDFNFSQAHPAPSWQIDLRAEIDPEVEASIDRQLIQMGVPLPLRYFYEKYRRPTVAEGERQLRYDDNNLFQYHLEFGVLTVNEVRSSLGLAPVSWGDRPTSPGAAENANTPTPSGGAGGGPSAEERGAHGDEESEEQELTRSEL